MYSVYICTKNSERYPGNGQRIWRVKAVAIHESPWYPLKLRTINEWHAGNCWLYWVTRRRGVRNIRNIGFLFLRPTGKEKRPSLGSRNNFHCTVPEYLQSIIVLYVYMIKPTYPSAPVAVNFRGRRKEKKKKKWDCEESSTKYGKILPLLSSFCWLFIYFFFLFCLRATCSFQTFSNEEFKCYARMQTAWSVFFFHKLKTIFIFYFFQLIFSFFSSFSSFFLSYVIRLYDIAFIFLRHFKPSNIGCNPKL